MREHLATWGHIGPMQWMVHPDDGRYGFGAYAIVVGPNNKVRFKVWYPSERRAEHAARAFIQELYEPPMSERERQLIRTMCRMDYHREMWRAMPHAA